MEGVTQHHSVVLYHMNGPVWYEMIKVLLSIEKYYGAHLRLEYRHCSSKLVVPVMERQCGIIYFMFSIQPKIKQRKD